MRARRRVTGFAAVVKAVLFVFAFTIGFVIREIGDDDNGDVSLTVSLIAFAVTVALLVFAVVVGDVLNQDQT